VRKCRPWRTATYVLGSAEWSGDERAEGRRSRDRWATTTMGWSEGVGVRERITLDGNMRGEEERGRGRGLTGARMKIPVNGTTGSRRPGTWRSASKDSTYPTRYVNGKKDGVKRCCVPGTPNRSARL